MESPRSPEAEIGHRVEDLWEVAEPQLSPSEKLNSCFEDIPVASFPRTHPSQVIEIPSDASLADTVEILSKNKILSAPIRNVHAPEDASWIDKYIGIVEFAGIAMWLLNQVNEDQPVLKAFQLMREKGVGGLPVMDTSGTKAIGNISIRDVQYLLTAPKIYKEYRTITATDFLTAVRHHLQEQHEVSPLLRGVITCKKDDAVKDIILKLDSEKIHRIYVIDDKGKTEGVITLRDIISKLVHEPRHYFGDFFDGVVPLPPNSTV